MSNTIRLSPDLYKGLQEVARLERRSVADTARLLIGSALARYKATGLLLDRAASQQGELVLFPLRLSSRSDS